ncbi:hypothetical protein CGLO_13939 [Colletotrichum gloeosporioides Cg-14]|uniref:Uncharacterized protein n=1 Tax=Colletotrichum gloeosporioides (strain Cg-14) TaxID=1237896 RepID=T0K2N4_COLGC|nr:hypothetical protein CGLO_13939 [Colletotrichum gloeosporioides Cg-14]
MIVDFELSLRCEFFLLFS